MTVKAVGLGVSHSDYGVMVSWVADPGPHGPPWREPLAGPRPPLTHLSTVNCQYSCTVMGTQCSEPV